VDVITAPHLLSYHDTLLQYSRKWRKIGNFHSIAREIRQALADFEPMDSLEFGPFFEFNTLPSQINESSR